MKKGGNPDFLKYKAILEKFLKEEVSEKLFLPAQKRELAQQLAALKNISKEYSLDFLLNEFSLPYKLNFITHLYSLKKEMSAAKLRAKLRFDSPPNIILEPAKIGEDRQVEKKVTLKEFLKT